MATLPDNLFSPTFKQQKLGLLFAMIMGIMVYLATLAMSLQAGISSTSLNWDQSQQGRLTVEIPADDENPALQIERTKLALDLLKPMAEISEINLLPEAEVARLLKPWINDEKLLASLPLPRLIDIQLKGGKNLLAEDLRNRLKSSIPDARVDDHADWLAQLHHIVHALTALGWFLIVLTGLALVIAISLICRTALAIEQRTIDLLHIMGASDEIIANSFAHHIQNLAWPSALIGFGLALLTVGGLGFLLTAFIVTETHDWLGWLVPASVLLLVPCLAILGAVTTAHTAVVSLLKEKP